MAPGTDEAPRGCYGIQLTGLPDADRFLNTVPAGSPTLRVRRRLGVTQSDQFELSDQRASLPLSDGRSRAVLDRSTGNATLVLAEEYADEALLHPLLSGSCAIANWWAGRDAFHAGAFELAGRAWVVMGDKGQGKSTTLGYLACHGVSVISDDLVVAAQGQVLAGPAFVDLRPDAAAQLECGRDMGMLGARPRFRLDVPAPRPSVELAGWVSLAWSDEVRLVRLPIAERLRLLFTNRAVRLAAASPTAFTAFAALPFFELGRPRTWSALPAVGDLLSRLPG